MNAPVRWGLGALAVAMIVVGLTGGGCARDMFTERQSESGLWRVLRQAQ